MSQRRHAGSAIALGWLLVAVSIGLALWPMNSNGLSGCAARPHYGAFGWFAHQPLPTNPKLSDLRRAGAILPQDLVATRRRQVSGLAGLGVVALGVGAYRRRRGVTERQPSAAR